MLSSSTFRHMQLSSAVLTTVLAVILISSGYANLCSANSYNTLANLDIISNYNYDRGLVDINIKVNATPRNSGAIVEVEVYFPASVEKIKIYFSYPSQYLFEEGESKAVFSQDSENHTLLWEGGGERGEKKSWTKSVNFQINVISELSVSGIYTLAENRFNVTDSKYVIVGDENVIVEDAPTSAYDKQVEYRLDKAGFGYLNIQDGESSYRSVMLLNLKQEDANLYWDLVYPYVRPSMRVDTVTAPDGAKLTYNLLPQYLLEQLPDSVRKKYNNPGLVVKEYIKVKNKSTPIEYFEPINFPEGFSYTDLPDSLMTIEDKSNWSAEERRAAHLKRRNEIRRWIQVEWRRKK